MLARSPEADERRTLSYGPHIAGLNRPHSRWSAQRRQYKLLGDQMLFRISVKVGDGVLEAAQGSVSTGEVPIAAAGPKCTVSAAARSSLVMFPCTFFMDNFGARNEHTIIAWHLEHT